MKSLVEKISMQKLLAYLADIFDSLNCLNLSMQGFGFTVINHAAKAAAFYKKLILWKNYAAQDQYDMFPELQKYISGKELDIKQTIIDTWNTLLKSLSIIIMTICRLLMKTIE